jgi:hypothetical protein
MAQHRAHVQEVRCLSPLHLHDLQLTRRDQVYANVSGYDQLQNMSAIWHPPAELKLHLPLPDAGTTKREDGSTQGGIVPIIMPPQCVGTVCTTNAACRIEGCSGCPVYDHIRVGHFVQ